MLHHHSYYPAKHYYGTKKALDTWKIDENNLLISDSFFGKFRHMLPGYTSIHHELLLYIFGFGILLGSYILRVPTKTIWAAFIGYLIMGFIANFLHQSFHVPNHFLNKYHWFKELNILHFRHHQGSTKNNLCVVNFAADKLAGTYVDTNPCDSAKEREMKKSNQVSSEEPHHHVPLDEKLKDAIAKPIKSALERGYFNVGMRLLVVAFFITLWYETQSSISEQDEIVRQLNGEHIIDRVHDFIEPIHLFITDNENVSKWLLITSTLLIDIMGLWIVFISITGHSFRPFFSLVTVFTLRQFCQLLVSLPSPPGMIWENPGVPSIFVTYDTGSDFFFSGHTAIATIFAIEMTRHMNYVKPAMILGALLLLFEASIVLVLKAHWFMDVLTAIICARWATYVSSRHSEVLDTILP
jgi:hypothetical protein